MKQKVGLITTTKRMDYDSHSSGRGGGGQGSLINSERMWFAFEVGMITV